MPLASRERLSTDAEQRNPEQRSLNMDALETITEWLATRGMLLAFATLVATLAQCGGR